MKYNILQSSNRHRAWKHALSTAGQAAYTIPYMWPWDSLTASDVSPFKYHFPRDPEWKVRLPLQWFHNWLFSFCGVRQKDHFLLVYTLLWAIMLPTMAGIVVMVHKSFLVGLAILTSVRRRVAYNSNTPPEILIALGQDVSSLVKSEVAGNPNTPHDILTLLSQSTHDNVC